MQRILCVLTLGDVARDHQDGGLAAVGERNRLYLDLYGRSIQPDEPQLLRADPFPSAGPLNAHSPGRFAVGVDEVHRETPEDLLGTFGPEQPDSRAVDVLDHELAVGREAAQKHHVGRRLHQQAVAFLAFPQGFRNPFAVTDVPGDHA